MVERLEASRGEVGGGEADAGLLGLAGREIELDSGRLVQIFRGEDLSKAVGPGCGELAGLELHDELLVGGTGGGCISRHTMALGQAEKGFSTQWRSRIRNQESLILRDGEIVELARVECVRTAKRRFRRRTATAGWSDANILRIIQNSCRRGGLRDRRNRGGLENWRRCSGRSGLYRLGTAHLDGLAIRQTIHPRGILIIFHRGSVCRKGAAHLLGLAQRSHAEQRENDKPLHCCRLVAKATFQIFAWRQASSTSTTWR